VTVTTAGGQTKYTVNLLAQGQGSFDVKAYTAAADGSDQCDPDGSMDMQGYATTMTGAVNFSYDLPAAAPDAPSGLSAQAGDAQVKLSWNADADATSYNIYENGHKIASTSSTSYTVTGLTDGVQYAFQVSGVDGAGEGALSQALAATPQATVVNPTPTPTPTPPTPPTPTPTPKPVPTKPSSGLPAVTWLIGGKPAKAPSAPHVKLSGHTLVLSLPKHHGGVVTYRVYRRTANGKYVKVGAVRGGQLVERHLKTGVKYTFAVVAVNAHGKVTKASKPVSVKVPAGRHK
jgi:hypothetical protein